MKKLMNKHLKVACITLAMLCALAVFTTQEAMAQEPQDVERIIQPNHSLVNELRVMIPSHYGHYLIEDSRRNLFLFSGPLNAYDRLMNLLKMIDTPTPRIRVECLFIEVLEPRKPGVDDPAEQFLRRLGPIPDGEVDFYQGVEQMPKEFLAQLTKWQKEGRIKLHGHHRLVGQAGEYLKIEHRKMKNFYLTETEEMKNSDVSAIIECGIKPTMMANSDIHLDLIMRLGAYSFTDEGLPTQSTCTAETKVAVAMGETVILGGFHVENLTSSGSGISTMHVLITPRLVKER